MCVWATWGGAGVAKRGVKNSMAQVPRSIWALSWPRLQGHWGCEGLVGGAVTESKGGIWVGLQVSSKAHSLSPLNPMTWDLCSPPGSDPRGWRGVWVPWQGGLGDPVTVGPQGMTLPLSCVNGTHIGGEGEVFMEGTQRGGNAAGQWWQRRCPACSSRLLLPFPPLQCRQRTQGPVLPKPALLL